MCSSYRNSWFLLSSATVQAPGKEQEKSTESEARTMNERWLLNLAHWLNARPIVVANMIEEEADSPSTRQSCIKQKIKHYGVLPSLFAIRDYCWTSASSLPSLVARGKIPNSLNYNTFVNKKVSDSFKKETCC